MHPLPKCQALPLPGQQVAFEIDGVERLRWHHGGEYPRPFFYPLAGPSGTSLTRMGHPGDFTHDHHRSVWFAHANVAGMDFWGEGGKSRIRQERWLAYDDRDGYAAMAVELGWYGPDGQKLIQHELVAAVTPLPQQELLIELQSTLTAIPNELTLGQSNFGLLAVRVAKNISGFFGGGVITSSAGRTGEAANFGEPAAWMDYSGPVRAGGREGITYMDHPTNLEHPPRWHVREDGWMGASICRLRPIELRPDSPFVVRYLLHVHRGAVDPHVASAHLASFSKLPPFAVVKATAKHTKFEIRRA